MSSRSFIRIAWTGIAVLLLAVTAPGFSVKKDPVGLEFYHMVRHLMTSQEEKTFSNLSTPEFLHEFIAAFWEIRDPDPTTEENEFRSAMEERFEFVNNHLREANRPGWDTARGMIYMVLGPPNLMNAASAPNPLSSQNENFLAGTIIWPYPELNINIFFIDRQGFGVYELDIVRTSPRLLELLKKSKTRFIGLGNQGMEDRLLEFRADIKPAKDRLLITIKTTALRFDVEADGTYTARIHLALNLYLPDGTIITQKDNRRIILDPVTKQKGKLRLEWTMPLKKGKSKIDLLVLDQVSGRSNRQFFSVKKR
jgi:GWxTD domain-containing protein